MRTIESVIDEYLHEYVLCHYTLRPRYVELCKRYCRLHCHLTKQPIGRAVAKFMMLFNKREGAQIFSDKAISFHYYY